MKKIRILGIVLMLFGALTACSSSEEKVEKFLSRGNANFEQGDFVKAVLECRNAMAIDPKNVEAAYMAGQAELRQGKIKEAYGYFMKTIATVPGHIDANLQLGRIYLGARDFAKAHERADAILEVEPENQRAVMLRSGILLAENKPQQAINELEGMQRQTEKEDDYYLLLAAAHAKTGNPNEAEIVLNQGVTARPESIRLLIGLANLYSQKKIEGKIEPILQKIIDIEPENPEHVERLAAYLWHTGEHDRAVVLLDKLIEQEKENEERWLKTASFYASRKAIDRAAEVASRGLGQHPTSYRLRFVAQEVELSLGRAENAIAILQECLSLDREKPEYVAAQQKLAELYFRLGDTGAAGALVGEVLAKNPNDVDAHLLQGDLYKLQGSYDQAVAEYRIVMQARPEELAVYPKIADAFFRNKQSSLALDILKQGLQVDSKAVELHKTLARLYIMERKLLEAEEHMRKVVELSPGDLAAIAELADFYIVNNSHDKATELYLQFVETAPQNPLGYIKLSQLYLAKGNKEEALAIINDGMVANPANSILLDHAVRLRLRFGQNDNALALVDERLLRQPDDTFAITMMGNIQVFTQQLDKAEESYRRVMALQPEQPEAAVSLAKTLIKAGKADTEISAVETTLKSTSTAPFSTYVLLAELHRGLGNQVKAAQVYEEAVQKFPESWFVLNNVAYSIADREEADTHDLARAEELARKAQHQAPGNDAVLDTLGWLLMKQGKLTQARASLAMALERNPHNPVYNYHMGMVLVQAGNTSEARAMLERAVRAPGNFRERGQAEETLKRLTL